jgi:ribosomal protein S27AE
MVNLTEEEKEDFKFLLKAADEIKECGVIYNFTCPRCGGTIIAERIPDNGYLHIKCGNCDFAVIG